MATILPIIGSRTADVREMLAMPLRDSSGKFISEQRQTLDAVGNALLQAMVLQDFVKKLPELAGKLSLAHDDARNLFLLNTTAVLPVQLKNTRWPLTTPIPDVDTLTSVVRDLCFQIEELFDCTNGGDAVILQGFQGSSMIVIVHTDEGGIIVQHVAPPLRVKSIAIRGVVEIGNVNEYGPDQLDFYNALTDYINLPRIDPARIQTLA